MPQKKAPKKKAARKSSTAKASPYIRDEMRKAKRGERKSPEQAIAIGLSKARRSGEDVPPPKQGTVSEATRKRAKRDLQAGKAKRKRGAARKSSSSKASARSPTKKRSARKSTAKRRS